MKPWGPEVKLAWYLKQTIKRSYADDVLARLETLLAAQNPAMNIEEYGRLTVNPERFPLYAIRMGDGKHRTKPNILVTGGVHGYETSGVKGALEFAELHALRYADRFNFIITPCISPWAYETINRLDPVMENPNREFKADGKAEESQLVMEYWRNLGWEFDGHIDLHETTDSDQTFLPEEYAKNGLPLRAEDVGIPDGYYLIGVNGHAQPALEKAIMDKVREVTHIAEPDRNGCILDTPISSEGVIHMTIPGLCAQYTGAVKRLGAYTTEMYPDSPRFKQQSVSAIEAMCSRAQVASIVGALDFWSSSF